MLPKLTKTNRSREYNCYKEEIRDRIVYFYLFEGISHRSLDETILSLDSASSKGWQSMGVLHYLGLTNEFKGLFTGKTIDQILDDLVELRSNEYEEVLKCLKRYREKSYLNLQIPLYVADEVEGYSTENINQYKGDDFSDLSDTEEIYEGLKKTIIVNKYERSTVARNKCVEHNGCFCHICNICFDKIYGELGNDFIHVHHIKPVSEIDQTYVIDFKNDLLPICPNCHAMIHRKLNEEQVSVEQLKRIVSYYKKLNKI